MKNEILHESYRVALSVEKTLKLMKKCAIGKRKIQVSIALYLRTAIATFGKISGKMRNHEGGKEVRITCTRTSVSLGAHSIPTLLPAEAFVRAKLKGGDLCFFISVTFSLSLARSLASPTLCYS